jgi:putative DNA-invertase from lambdoid prophage Rac
MTAPVAVVYLRVSKKDGSQHVENQQPDVEALAAARGFSIIETFTDNESAVKRRPGLAALMTAFRSGKCGSSPTLIIWSLDRLGRGLGCFDTYRELCRLGVRVLSCREPWLDQPDVTRDLLAMLMAWVSGFERSRLIERTKAGLERAKRKGQKLGRPQAQARVQIQSILAMRAEGLSLQSIGERCGCSHSTVLRILKAHAQTIELNKNGDEKEPSQPSEIAGAA